MTVPTFDEYLESLTQLGSAADPTELTAQTAVIKAAAEQLDALPLIEVDSLVALIEQNPEYVPALGLAVGLSQERLKNALRHHLGTSGYLTLARERAGELINVFDREYGLLALLEKQRGRTYDFGDVLVARAGTRATAHAAGVQGRKVEDEIEAIVKGLGLSYALRTRFTGRNGRTAPCDIAVPGGNEDARIVVAAKGFDSTGSKLTAAVTEVTDMSDVRTPTQYVMAVIDGIGWKNRQADLRRLHTLWADQAIDGMYTLSTLDQFRIDIKSAAIRVGLLNPDGTAAN